MEVREVLVRALEEVDEAKVPAELRSVAFGKAVDLVAIGAGKLTAPSQQVRQDQQNRAGDAQTAADLSPLEKVATRLKLDLEVVQDVFDHDDQGLRIIVSPKKLDKRIRPGARQLALLVVSGRQAAGDDEDWTSVDTIRKVCEDYNKLDAPNFAAHIKAMKDEFNLKGSPQKREVKLTRPGWEAARELVEKLAGGEG
jgi:hypothetical protein